MKILLTVLMHNQAQYAERMFRGIAAQERQPDEVLVMLDRPSGKDIVATRQAFAGMDYARVITVMSEPDYLGRPQMTPGVEQFCSGYMRNKAVRYALDSGFDGVVFIDGDCIPGNLLVKDHEEQLSMEGAVATVGRRNEAKHNYLDQRQIPDIMPIPIFKEWPYLVTEEPFYVDSGVVWTCNFGMNRAALQQLVDLNRKLFGRGEASSSDFNGTWGGEDGYIGFQCLYTGIRVFSLPHRDAGVLHIEHERPVAKYNHSTFLQYLEAKRIELMTLLELYGMGTCGHEIRPAKEIIGDRPWRNAAK